jgi:hypothetical protein
MESKRMRLVWRPRGILANGWQKSPPRCTNKSHSGGRKEF